MIIFNEAQTMAYSTKFNYLGDIFNYNNSSTIQIRGRLQSDKSSDGGAESFFGMAYVTDGGIWTTLNGTETATTGVTPTYSGYLSFDGGEASVSLMGANLFSGNYSPLYDIWGSMDSIKSQFQDFQPIYINGVPLGSGRVTKINFPQSKDPRVSTYEAEIQLYKSGNLYNLTGQNYQNISSDPLFYKYISSVGEEFSFATEKDGVISYDRNLNFNCVNPNLSDSALISGVQSFASGLLYNDPVFQLSLKSYPDFYQAEGSRYFTESYNNILGSYSFSEKFQGPTSGEKYRWTNSLSVSLGGEGPSVVSEKGQILGVRKDIVSSAYEGMADIESSAISRATSFYNAYNNNSGVCSSGLFLKTKNKVINQEAGLIEYSFQYSNDPFSNGCYNVSREIQLNRDLGGVYSVSEKGAVKNVCETTSSGRLAKSIEYFNNNISGGVYTRLYDYYTGNSSGCGCPGYTGSFSNQLRKAESNLEYSEFEGVFGYSYLYRDSCTSLINGCYLYSQETSSDYPVENVSFVVTPYNGEVALEGPNGTTSAGTTRITTTLIGQCTGLTYSGYNTALSLVPPFPSGAGSFVSSESINFDPDNSKIVHSIEITY